MNNKQRAKGAQFAIMAYCLATDRSYERNPDLFTDLITDLLHLLAKWAESGDNMDYVLRLAYDHYQAERGKPDEGR